jgi:hypothetical protein
MVISPPYGLAFRYIPQVVTAGASIVRTYAPSAPTSPVVELDAPEPHCSRTVPTKSSMTPVNGTVPDTVIVSVPAVTTRSSCIAAVTTTSSTNAPDVGSFCLTTCRS